MAENETLAPSTQIEEDSNLVFNFLDANVTFEGNTQEFADALGIENHRLASVLHRVRSEEWIKEEGWTIPNVKKGPGAKTWSVAVGDEPTDEGRLRDGLDKRMPEVVETLRRLRGAARLGSALYDGRSREGRKWRLILKATDLAVEMAEDVEVEVGVPDARLDSRVPVTSE